MLKEERVEMNSCGIGEDENGKEFMKLIERNRAEAFMDGFKYAIRILQDALIKEEKAE